MRHQIAAIALAGVFLSASGALAGEQTVALGVDGMSGCPACPYFVKETLEDVQGVKSVEISMVEQAAYVVFDDDLTSIDELTAAMDYMGFPSYLIETGS